MADDGHEDMAQLEAQYATLLESLEGERREQVVQRMAAPDRALRSAEQQHESEKFLKLFHQLPQGLQEEAEGWALQMGTENRLMLLIS